jgi:hypothetical protein
MLNHNRFRRAFGATIIASALAMTALTQQASADPAPGTCKFRFQHAVAQSVQGAQEAWISEVAAKFGSKWAQWAGAKNKTVVPLNGGLYQAKAKPCFYQPVL